MCGIAGILKPINQENELADLKMVAGALIHRGPDDEGFLKNPEALLAHRRLSIIDLGGGHQPMYNKDKSVTVIFNGEIYNYRELRHQLEHRKHQFTTQSDTEVLLHLYEEFGTSMGKCLNGMFAFVICDFTNQRALLIRDRAGQKPLFYAHQNNELYFSSELGAMKKFKSLQRDIDPEAINLFFSLQYIPAPRTIYHNVKKLLPGELLEYNFRNNSLKVQRYWHLDFSQKSKLSFDDAAAEFREILIDSVRLRMVADVPLGVFLSGGVDSSIIAGIMAQLSPGSIKSFSIGFNESDYDERRYSALAAQAINAKNNDALDYREHIVDCGDFKLMNTLLSNLGEPYADASIMPTAMLSDFARSNVTVALSGDGADELFGGYDRYIVMKYIHNFDILPPAFRRHLFGTVQQMFPDNGERSSSGRLRRLMGVIAAAEDDQYFQLMNRTNEHLRKRLFGEMMTVRGDDGRSYIADLFRECTTPDQAEKALEVDFNSYLFNDVLTKVDIASMNSSLEVRNPFLDHRVMEFAAQLPIEYKISGRNKKHFLKYACRDFLPPIIANQPKRGFGVPLANYFRHLWRDDCQEILADCSAAKSGFLNQAEINQIWDIHQRGKLDLSYLIWNILTFEIFMRKEMEA